MAHTDLTPSASCLTLSASLYSLIWSIDVNIKRSPWCLARLSCVTQQHYCWLESCSAQSIFVLWHCWMIISEMCWHDDRCLWWALADWLSYVCAWVCWQLSPVDPLIDMSRCHPALQPQVKVLELTFVYNLSLQSLSPFMSGFWLSLRVWFAHIEGQCSQSNKARF